MGRSSWYEYEDDNRYSFPVTRMVEFHLTESDTLGLLENSERRELTPRLYLRFAPRADPQSYLTGDKRGCMWLEIPLTETAGEILNLKPIMSKHFGFKFDFAWKVRRGLYDGRLFYYTDQGSMSRITNEKDVDSGNLCIY